MTFVFQNIWFLSVSQPVFFYSALSIPHVPSIYPHPWQSGITLAYLHPYSACTAVHLGVVQCWVYSHCLRDHPHLLHAVRSLRLSPNSVVFQPSVSPLCCPKCDDADLATRLWNFSHILWSSSSCRSFRPYILTCSGRGSGCSLSMSNIGGMCGSRSIRGCRSLWSETLCTLTCHMLSLSTWWRPCSDHWKTLLIVPSP